MRQLDNWIGGFLDYTSGLNSPKIYRMWAGISAVSAALQRRCFTDIMESILYPNLFVLLVGKPGGGKSLAIKHARNILRKHPQIHLAPQRCTKEAFYAELEGAASNQIIDGLVTTSHSLTGLIDEFGVFVRRGDLDFMTDISDLYDAPDPFEYKTLHSKKLVLARSWFSFISGCTPQWLRETFTEVALEQGFPARIIAVFSDERFIPTLFPEKTRKFDKEDQLIALNEDLKEIMNLDGEFAWDKDAKESYQEWVSEGMKPYPPDPRLEHYCTRRVIHIPKLAMVVSAARRSTMTITREDYLTAQRILLETEMFMHEAYTAIGKNPYFTAIESVMKLVFIEYGKSKKPIPEHKLRRALEREVQFHLVTQIIDQLIASNRLIAEGIAPRRLFIPTRSTDDEIGGVGQRPEAASGGET